MQLFGRTDDLQYPVLSRVAIGVGLIGMGVSVFGSWRFGLSLTADWIDRYWLAFLFSVGDVAAGVMVAIGGTMLAREGWRTKLGGVLAMIPALLLVAISVLSTFGVMSGRIATLAGQQKAAQLDQERLKWLRGSTVNDEIAKRERSSFIAEEREAHKEARKAAAVVTDNQAVAFVNLAALASIKMTVEGAQVALTLISSTIPMSVKFICLGLGFLLYGYKRNPQDANTVSDVSGTVSGSSGGPGGGSVKRSQANDGKAKSSGETVAAKGQIVPWRKAETPVASSPIHKSSPSLSEYLKQHAGVTYMSQAALAKATGFSPAKVHRELKRLEGRGKVKRSKHKRGANLVTYGGRGGLQAVI